MTLPALHSAAKILGWDTSSRRGYLFAAEVDTTLVGTVRVVLRHSAILDVDQRQHSEGLLLGVSDALDATGWKLDELSALGVGIGPGSFTGIRIGLTTARTLGQMVGLPLLGVSSLEMLERAVRRSRDSGPDPVLIGADACMGEMYFRWGAHDKAQSAEVVTKVARLGECLTRWRNTANGTLTAVLPDTWSAHPVLKETFNRPDWNALSASSLVNLPHALADLVAENWSRGGALPALEVHPVYLRVSDAELHLRSRENELRNPTSGG